MDMDLKEFLVNLKSYNFDTFIHYKMDENEANKIIKALERLDEKKKAERYE